MSCLRVLNKYVYTLLDCNNPSMAALTAGAGGAYCLTPIT